MYDLMDSLSILAVIFYVVSRCKITAYVCKVVAEFYVSSR